jgi:hypothetical protein
VIAEIASDRNLKTFTTKVTKEHKGDWGSVIARDRNPEIFELYANLINLGGRDITRLDF